ncbi:DUF1761 domain-containing protein [Candidatus Dependentiae bacterium]|nr:DUF1761 domain-containing protein [Candidatus Dependentiae bacterium]
MDISFFSHLNYVAVLVSSLAFFFIGSVWFSGLFGSIWVEELGKHGIKIKKPSSSEIMSKMILTFAANVIASLAMAWLVEVTGSSTLYSGFILGKIVAIGFAATAIGSVFIWESKSLKLFLIDAGYPAVGIIVSAIILSVWH